MGYLSHVSGSLTITPPLTYSEFRGTPFTEFFAAGGGDIFRLHIQEEEQETPAGTLIVRTASDVEPYEDSVKAYTAVETLQRLVDAFPGREFRGCIEGEGEDSGDMWRLYVHDGRVIEHKPEIVWPEAPGVES